MPGVTGSMRGGGGGSECKVLVLKCRGKGEGVRGEGCEGGLISFPQATKTMLTVWQWP